jgi:hypothetical protein
MTRAKDQFMLMVPQRSASTPVSGTGAATNTSTPPAAGSSPQELQAILS